MKTPIGHVLQRRKDVERHLRVINLLTYGLYIVVLAFLLSRG